MRRHGALAGGRGARGLVLGLLAVLAACRGCGQDGAGGADAGPAEPAGPQQLTEREPSDRPDQALSLERDALVQAELKADPTRADEDWYRLAPGGPTAVEVGVSAVPGTDVVLEILDGDRNRLLAVNGGGEGAPERVPNLFLEGEKYARVTAARKGTGGPYTLTVRYRAASDGEEREPNDRAADAHALALGQPVTGFIGSAADEDWYRVELASDAAGEPAPGAAPSPAPVPAPAPAAPQPGAAPAAPADGTQPAAPPTEGEQAAPAEDPNAGLQGLPQGVNPLETVAPGAPPPTEPPGVALRLELTALPGVRPEVRVLTQAEAVLFEQRASKEGEPLQLRNVGVRATDKVVYVVVRSAWAGAGKEARRGFNAEAPYTLTVAREEAGANSELEPNNDRDHGTVLPVAIPGSAFRDGYLAPAGDLDLFTVRTSGPALLRVELSGVERLDLVLSQVEAPAEEGGKEVVTLRANDGAVKEPELLNSVRCDGTCWLRVEGATRKVEGKNVNDFENAQAPYRLSVTAEPDTGIEEREPNNATERAHALELGKPVRGTVHPRRDVDYFRLDLSDREVRTPLRASLLGVLKVDVGLYLHRLDDEGRLQLVQTSDRAKGDKPELIRYSAEPGVYVLEVRDARNRESNFQDRYQLTVEEGE